MVGGHFEREELLSIQLLRTVVLMIIHTVPHPHHSLPRDGDGWVAHDVG